MPTLATRAGRPPALSRSAKILIAAVLSVVIHLLVLLLLAWTLPHWPRGHSAARPLPIRLTIIRSTPAPDQARKSTGGSVPPPYIATQDEQQSDKVPDQPSFISDKNTLAASEKPASGFEPLPTQDGKQIPAFDFDTRPFRLDKVASSAASAAAAGSAANQDAAQQKEKQPKTQNPAPDSKAKPLPQSTPQPTPNIKGESPFLKADASPTPGPTPMQTPDASNEPPPPEAQPQPRQARPMTASPSLKTSPGLPKPPGYQPETIQTKMAGSINNRGRSAVAAMGTPMGRYNKLVSDAVGMRWYYEVQEHADLISVGSVKIHFVVTQSGKIQNVKIISGKANSELATVSLTAITEAEIPPIPADVAATLEGNQLEVDYDFSEY